MRRSPNRWSAGRIWNESADGDVWFAVNETSRWSSRSATATPDGVHRRHESVDASRLLYPVEDRSNGNGAVRVDGAITPNASSSFGYIESPSRARAATIGNFDGDHRETIMRRRAGTTAGLAPHPAGLSNGAAEESAAYLGVTRGMRAMSLAQNQVSD